MKIEVAESLIYSWLRHEKKCQIVQTNWKSSLNWDLKVPKKDLKKLYDKTKNSIMSKYLEGNSDNKIPSIEQFLKQAEIDVLGLYRKVNKDKGENNTDEVFAIDVAFHENGLQYASNDKKVAQKFIRSAFCLYAYFLDNNTKAHIVFATPKINPKPLENLKNSVKEVEKFIKEEFGIVIEFIYNESFYDKIVNTTINQCKNNCDTTELFIRANSLYNLSYEKYKQKYKKILKECIDRLKEKGVIAPNIITKLKQKNFSKTKFNINIPLLSEKKSLYYNQKIYINEKQYYVCQYYMCTECSKDQLDKLKNWIDTL